MLHEFAVHAVGAVSWRFNTLPSVTVRRDTVRTEVKQPSATCSVQFSVLRVIPSDLESIPFRMRASRPDVSRETYHLPPLFVFVFRVCFRMFHVKPFDRVYVDIYLKKWYYRKAQKGDRE